MTMLDVDLGPLEFYEAALDRLGGWIMASSLPQDAWQTTHDLLTYLLTAHKPVHVPNGLEPAEAWWVCEDCTDDTELVDWPCRPYRLAIAVLGDVAACDHRLGVLPCTNAHTHEGAGHGCTHDAGDNTPAMDVASNAQRDWL